MEAKVESSMPVLSEHEYSAIVLPEYKNNNAQRKLKHLSRLKVYKLPCQPTRTLPIVDGRHRGYFRLANIIFEQNLDVFSPNFVQVFITKGGARHGEIAVQLINLYNVLSMTRREIDGHSWANDGGDDAVADWTEAMVEAGVPRAFIGIITIYKHDAAVMRTVLAERGLYGVEINDQEDDVETTTIGAFQGREKNIILMHFVAADPSGQSGLGHIAMLVVFASPLPVRREISSFSATSPTGVRPATCNSPNR